MTRFPARLGLAAFRLAAVAAVTAICILASGPVAAAPSAAPRLGTIRLSATSGTVDRNPILASASTSKPCPKGYGADAQLRVGRPGGPFSNLARPLTSGGYDKAAVSAKPNRSFVMALGGVQPVDGEWWVVVECFSVAQGLNPLRFITEITVSGPRWRVGRPAGSLPAGDAGPTSGAPGAAAPEGGSAAPSSSAGSAAQGAGAPNSTSTVDPKLAGNNGWGSASLAVGPMLAVAGVLLVVGLVVMVTRRRQAPASATATPANARAKTQANARTKTKTRV